MRALLTALALVCALLLQLALSQIAPAQARLLDPFLIVLVYCGLASGETHGMLAGASGGWLQDVYFGGTIVGLSALSKIVVGFGVGVAGARLLVTGASQRLLVLFMATLIDALVFERLANVFDVRINELTFAAVVGRATVNAIAGAGIYELVDRRLRREARP